MKTLYESLLDIDKNKEPIGSFYFLSYFCLYSH